MDRVLNDLAGRSGDDIATMKGSIATPVESAHRASPAELAILGATWLAIAVTMAAGIVATPLVTTLAASTARSSGLAVAALFLVLAIAVPVALAVAGGARVHQAVRLAHEPKPALPLRQLPNSDGETSNERSRPAGGRAAPEVAIGRFGAAVFRQIPGDAAVRRFGDHFEFQVDGQWIPFDEPARHRDATGLQVVPEPAESAFVAQVYAAVVTTPGDENERPGCAILRPDQILPFLAGLPVHGLGELKADESLSALVA
jgi:hypothetical protein